MDEWMNGWEWMDEDALTNEWMIIDNVGMNKWKNENGWWMNKCTRMNDEWINAWKWMGEWMYE